MKFGFSLCHFEWLPQIVEVDMKDERKKLKLAVLRGKACRQVIGLRIHIKIKK